MNSSIIVKHLNLEQVSDLVDEITLPLWAHPSATKYYDDIFYLVAYKSSRIMGIWPVPTTIHSRGLIAKRSCRLLPYCSPVLFVKSNLEALSVTKALFLELIQSVSYVAIPLSPNFLNVSVFQNYGALVEWRHTHVLDQSWYTGPLPSKVANHLRYAQANLRIEKSYQHEKFLSGAAIQNENDNGINTRSQLAKTLLDNRKAYLLSAYLGTEIVGQSFVVLDDQTHYIFHTWSLNEAARGIVIALIHSAAKECFSEYGPQAIVDLEGSVLPGVDKFFYSLNGNILPYGYLFWSRDDSFFTSELKAEVMPPERLILSPSISSPSSQNHSRTTKVKAL